MELNKPEGTFVKRFKVVADIQAMPTGMDAATFAKLCDAGFIMYDSSKGNRPKLYCVEGDVDPITIPVFVDTKGDEVDIKDLQKQWEDDEYWRKELYKCKQSPLHYFTNYLSVTAKPSQEEINVYLTSIGMGATTDSESQTPEEIKKVREEYAKTVLLEDLKNLKPVKDKLLEEYDVETKELLKDVYAKHELTGSNEKMVIDKMIADILKVKPKDAPQKLKYYIEDKSGRWDKSLLRMTDIDELVRLWKLI